MSHEPKSPSLGMLSTATRTTATVSPLTPSPLNGSIVPNGSPAASSTLSVQAAPSSSFAAALRKLAKQAEEPRGGDRHRGTDRVGTNTQELVFSWISQLCLLLVSFSRGQFGNSVLYHSLRLGTSPAPSHHAAFPQIC